MAEARRLPLFLLLLVAVGRLAAAVPTTEAAVIEWQLPRSTDLAVGDELELRLTYRWPADWPVLVEADPARDFAELRLTAVEQRDARRFADRQESIWQVAVLVERSGAWELPTPRLVLQGPDGPVRASCEPLLLQVGLPDGEPPLEEARGLWTRPPIDLEQPLSPWWYLGGAAVLLAGLVVGWWYWRRPPAATAVAAETVARQALARARQAGDGKQAAGIISLALRRYCGVAWAFDGVGATAAETISHITGRATDTERQDLRKLFHDLDGLRWAPGELTAATVGPYVDQALGWLERVAERLRQEAEAEAAGPDDRGAAA